MVALGVHGYPPTTDLPHSWSISNGVISSWGCAAPLAWRRPVALLYSPRDVTVSARVVVLQGTHHEWYPDADRVSASRSPERSQLESVTADGSITWTTSAVSLSDLVPASSPATCSRIGTTLLARPIPRPSASRNQCWGAAREVPFLSRALHARLRFPLKLTSDGNLCSQES